MIKTSLSVLIAVLLQLTGAQKLEVVAAANKYVSGVTWQQDSIAIGDFTCAGHKEQAILGVRQSETVVAIFLNGTASQPQIIRNSKYDPKAVKLKIEALDYDPKDIIDGEPEGFQKSKTCIGMTIGDGDRDSLHIYWNHKSRKFDSWSL
jgi:hypothetical protein